MKQFTVKSFQQATIDHVVNCYKSSIAGRRVLVADEVGLGKTIIAKEVIESFIKKRSVSRGQDEALQVIYICSNSDIAQQNVDRICSDWEERGISRSSSRITLWPLRSKPDGDLDLVPITPGTSFRLSHNLGVKAERKLLHGLFAVLYPGLKALHGHEKTWSTSSYRAARFFQGYACKDDPERWLEEVSVFHAKRIQLIAKDKTRRGFLNELLSEWRVLVKDLSPDEQSLLNKDDSVLESTLRLIKQFPDRDLDNVNNGESLRKARNFLVGALRTGLASAALKLSQPALVILDEFQNFSEFLQTALPSGKKSLEIKIAHKLLSSGAPILLLSATPYKAMTADFGHIGSSHYSDFIKTLAFLFEPFPNGQEIVGQLKGDFERFRELLCNPEIWSNKDKYVEARALQRKIQSQLMKVMVRTERHTFLKSMDVGVEEQVPMAWVDVSNQGRFSLEQLDDGRQPKASDVAYLRWLEKTAPEDQKLMVPELWASIPYAYNLMGSHYKLFQENMKSKQGRSLLAQYAQEVRRHRRTEPLWAEISDLIQLNLAEQAPNPKVRVLLNQLRKEDFGKFLWLPPTLPYYTSAVMPPEMPKKRLVFSRWQAVPQALSILASLDTEVRWTTQFSKGKRAYYLSAKHGKDRPVLTLNYPTREGGGKSTLTIFHPSIGLAQLIDPFTIGQGRESLEHVRTIARDSIVARLSELNVKIQGQKIQGKQLELARVLWRMEPTWVRHLYRDAVHMKSKPYMPTMTREETGDGLEKHLKALIEEGPELRTTITLSEEDVESLVQIAVGGPGVCLMRALLRLALVTEETTADSYSQILKVCHGNLRRMFLTMPAGLAVHAVVHNADLPAWRKVVAYSEACHIQATLDEYIFLLDHDSAESDSEKRLVKIAKSLDSCLGLPSGSPIINGINFKSQTYAQVEKRARRHIAQAFGDDKSRGDGGEQEILRDQIRLAFNTPFWPFLLVTTSIGQEGLDFHRYCKDVVHWNLPSNPIAFEQREGRIQRYLGLAIREALAADFTLEDLLRRKKGKENPWVSLTRLAEARANGSASHGMSPYWIYKTSKTEAKIRRWLFCHPFSKEAVAYRRMRESVLLYRLAIGQPRQQDFMAAIQRNINSKQNGVPDATQKEAMVKSLWIDLAPWTRKRIG